MTETAKNLEPVPFHDHDILTFEHENGEIYVLMKPIVLALELNWSAQYKRIKRNPVFARGVSIMETPLAGSADQEAVFLPLKLFHGWLFTVNAGRIPDERKRKVLIQYQMECFDVLHDYWQKKRNPQPMKVARPHPMDNPYQELRFEVEGPSQEKTGQSLKKLGYAGFPVTDTGTRFLDEMHRIGFDDPKDLMETLQFSQQKVTGYLMGNLPKKLDDVYELMNVGFDIIWWRSGSRTITLYEEQVFPEKLLEFREEIEQARADRLGVTKPKPKKVARLSAPK